MKLRSLLLRALVLVILGLVLAGTAWLLAKRPQRDGLLHLDRLQAPVEVRFDERGVPHLRARNDDDLYRALGWLHAQDRLFQMEMLRRLARGELAEILGMDLVATDRLFRVLRLDERASQMASRLEPDAPWTRALDAYLDGVNQYQRRGPAPIEFDLLGIPRRDFTREDSFAVAGYTAYSFAAGLRTEPILSVIRQRLGAAHLAPFATGEARLTPPAPAASASIPVDGGASAPAGPGPAPNGGAGPSTRAVDQAVWIALAQRIDLVPGRTGLPRLEGSNAWVLSGDRTRSGKPLLAGDPHIMFAVPAVWWEAHLESPGFELYGYFQALNPLALLGHGPQTAWSLTMFQNDDLDLIREHTDPDHPNQVRIHGAWVPVEQRETEIRVKGRAPERLTLRRTPHGPVVNDALDPSVPEAAPLALWWAWLESENPLMEAFYRLNRAGTLDEARAAAERIHAPGLNVVWAHARGDFAWWAAARLPQRPPGVRADLILDGATAEADKPGFLPFAQNPQEENPARGYIVSANHEPAPSRQTVPSGYYNPSDRARRLDRLLADPTRRWDVTATQSLQRDTGSDVVAAEIHQLVEVVRPTVADDRQRAWLDRLAQWSGEHRLDGVEPTLATQWLWELARLTFSDELGEAGWQALSRTRAFDHALPRIVADPTSPWWDRIDTPDREDRAVIARQAWQAALDHLARTFGADRDTWTWQRAHTLTHGHPLGRVAVLDRWFNVGPFPVGGSRETIDNMAFAQGPAPWPVIYGPSTRRIVDLADPGSALGGNPVGQSGVRIDRHYADQAEAHAAGRYQAQHLKPADVQAHTRSQLLLQPR